MQRKIDRFDKFMKHIGVNDNQVTKSLSLSIGTLGKSRKEGRDLSARNIEKILNYFIQINPEWLVTGEGEMLRKDSRYAYSANSSIETKVQQHTDIYTSSAARTRVLLSQLNTNGYSFTELQQLLNINTEQFYLILSGKSTLTKEMLEKLRRETGVNPLWIEGESENIFLNDINASKKKIQPYNTVIVPYISTLLRKELINIEESPASLPEHIAIIETPEMNPTYGIVFEVNGDSMEPTFISGEKVYAEKVQRESWAYTTGPVVVCFDDYVVVKRIKDNLLVSNVLTLTSDHSLENTITISPAMKRIKHIYKIRHSVYRPVRNEV